MTTDHSILIHQAFRAWLEVNGHALARQVTIDDPAPDGLTFRFDVGYPTLIGWLNEHDLSVAVMRCGTVFDILTSLDVEAVQDGDRWRCAMCHKEGRDRTLPSREAVWIDHLFDPLAQCSCGVRPTRARRSWW